MFPSILNQGLLDVSAPAQLHAELWGDHFSKVISCWLPLLMSTIVVGRDLLGSSTQCFPLYLAPTPVQPKNKTLLSDGNSTNGFSGVSDYTRQLAEFVNTYCAGKDSIEGRSMFSYQQFAMTLVIQAGVMYIPFLIWNIGIGRDIICNLKFILHDMEVLYKQHHGDKQNSEDKSQESEGVQVQQPKKESGVVSVSKELEDAERKWRTSCSMYSWYVFGKQALSIVISVVFFISYWFQPISIYDIHDKFSCLVEEQFSVTCTVPTAPVYRCLWITNTVLIGSNVLLIVINLVLLCHNHVEELPFRELGMKTAVKTAQCLTHCNDSSLMHAFFKANIESFEKYHYARNLNKASQKR